MSENVLFWVWFVSCLGIMLYNICTMFTKHRITYRDMIWFLLGAWSIGAPFIIMNVYYHITYHH